MINLLARAIYPDFFFFDSGEIIALPLFHLWRDRASLMVGLGEGVVSGASLEDRDWDLEALEQRLL